MSPGERDAIDVRGYLRRIGHGEGLTPSLATLSSLQRAHLQAIPFEGIDPLLGRRIKLDAEALQDKLIRGRRGGYCFEQNTLFGLALRQLGFEVTPLAARSRWGRPDDYPRTPLSHMLLMVQLAEGPVLADVGFGGPGPVRPLPFTPDADLETPLGVYRISHAADGYRLSLRTAEGWTTLYDFTCEPQSPADFEVFSWYASTYPASGFTRTLIASRLDGDRRVNLHNFELTLRGADGAERIELAGPGALRDALAERFGIALDEEDFETMVRRLTG